jgi:hypothetical protein
MQYDAPYPQHAQQNAQFVNPPQAQQPYSFNGNFPYQNYGGEPPVSVYHANSPQAGTQYTEIPSASPPWGPPELATANFAGGGQKFPSMVSNNGYAIGGQQTPIPTENGKESYGKRSFFKVLFIAFLSVFVVFFLAWKYWFSKRKGKHKRVNTSYVPHRDKLSRKKWNDHDDNIEEEEEEEENNDIDGDSEKYSDKNNRKINKRQSSTKRKEVPKKSSGDASSSRSGRRSKEIEELREAVSAWRPLHLGPETKENEQRMIYERWITQSHRAKEDVEVEVLKELLDQYKQYQYAMSISSPSSSSYPDSTYHHPQSYAYNRGEQNPHDIDDRVQLPYGANNDKSQHSSNSRGGVDTNRVTFPSPQPPPQKQTPPLMSSTDGGGGYPSQNMQEEDETAYGWDSHYSPAEGGDENGAGNTGGEIPGISDVPSYVTEPEGIL